MQRKKEAKEKFERDLKEERKRIKVEAKESYKKLVVSHRPIPELENLISEEYEDDEVTVKVVELGANDIAKRNHWIGANQPKYDTDKEESEEEDQNAEEEVPGMELKPKKKVVENKNDRAKFQSEKDVKRALKKQATKTVKKSKVFQMKNKLERQKQKKKSLQMKKQRMKFHKSDKGYNKKKRKE